MIETKAQAHNCKHCSDNATLGFDFTMAFQPMLDVDSKQPFAFEALVRGPNGEAAAWVLNQVNPKNIYTFDQSCRTKAIHLASKLGLQDIGDCKLSINFLPNAVYEPAACISKTLEACKISGFPSERLMFEVSESQKLENTDHLIRIFKDYESRGFTTSIDDFGAGYSGLNLLSEFQPQIIKIDMGLIRNIHTTKSKQAITRGIVSMCHELNMTVIGEGVESSNESQMLRELGVKIQQGYFFARPSIETLAF